MPNIDTNDMMNKLSDHMARHYPNLTMVSVSMVIERPTKTKQPPPYPIIDMKDDEWVVPAGPVTVDFEDTSTFLYTRKLPNKQTQVVCIYALRADRPLALELDQFKTEVLADPDHAPWIKSITIEPFNKKAGN